MKFRVQEKKIPQPVSARMFFDTGSSVSYLNPAIIRDLQLRLAEPQCQISVFGGGTELVDFYSGSLSISRDNLEVSMDARIGSANSHPETDGLLGRDALRGTEFSFNPKTLEFKLRYVGWE
jgi:hypothetical protein